MLLYYIILHYIILYSKVFDVLKNGDVADVVLEAPDFLVPVIFHYLLVYILFYFLFIINIVFIVIIAIIIIISITVLNRWSAWLLMRSALVDPKRSE